MTWRSWCAVVVAIGVGVSNAAQLAAAKIASYREPPYGACRFVQEQFGAIPDPWQEQALIAVCDPAQRRISLQACAGPGKSALLAWAGWYGLSTQCSPGDHPNGFATSVTGDNLRDNLWKEFAKWQSQSAYLSRAFTWTATRLFANEYPATWFLAARAWPKTGSAEQQGATFSGLHGRHIIVLCDESGAIPPTILRAAEQALGTAGGWSILMQAGNPISLEGMLYAAATQLAHQWTIIRITGDPDDPTAWVHAPRVGPGPAEWARAQIQTYGRDNPWVQSYILGKFPPSSINSLLGPEDVQAAIARELREDVYSWAQARLGVDVARYGDDRTVIFPRQGLRAFLPMVMRHARDSAVSTDIATRVLAMAEERKAKAIIMDATGGWAAGAADVLKASGSRPVEIQFHAPGLNERYRNRRAEMWFAMAERVKADLWLPNVQELVAELSTPTYTFLNGKLLLEPKEQVKERLGRSPDLADALALTFAVPEGARVITKPTNRRPSRPSIMA